MSVFLCEKFWNTIVAEFFRIFKTMQFAVHPFKFQEIKSEFNSKFGFSSLLALY